MISIKMPSRQELLALATKVDPADEIIANYVSVMKFHAERSAEAGSKRVGDSIHRRNPEFRLIHEIMDALKKEFTDCLIELNAWSSLCKSDDYSKLEFGDPKIDFYEIIVEWCSTTSPQQDEHQ